MAFAQSSGLESSFIEDMITLPALPSRYLKTERFSSKRTATQSPSINLLPAKYDKKRHMCAAVCVSGYSNFCWEQTQAGVDAHQKCPLDLHGTASWTCGDNGRWSTITPDLRFDRGIIFHQFFIYLQNFNTYL